MTLLIDADYLVYKSCVSAETEIDFGDDVIVVTSRFSDAIKMVNTEIKRITDALGSWSDSPLLFFSDTRNFRKTIDPDYKGHRNRKKPCGYKRVINQLKEEFEVVTMETLEADDALGIYATKEPGHVICSPDKDMRQIPGDLYDLTNEVVTINKTEADRWHLIQTMSGDQTDGYAGIPGIGIKRAETLLDKNGATWETVLDAFVAKDLTEADAIRNARLAKILRNENYDWKAKQPILWSPTPSGGSDD